MRHIKPVAVVLLALSLGWVGGLSQTSQTVTINVNQSLYLDCSASAAITHTVTQSNIEGAQPFTIGTWSCNVDSLTAFTLNANMVITTNTGISGLVLTTSPRRARQPPAAAPQAVARAALLADHAWQWGQYCGLLGRRFLR
jgi:hypothetical protein